MSNIAGVGAFSATNASQLPASSTGIVQAVSQFVANAETQGNAAGGTQSTGGSATILAGASNFVQFGASAVAKLGVQIDKRSQTIAQLEKSGNNPAELAHQKEQQQLTMQLRDLVGYWTKRIAATLAGDDSDDGSTNPLTSPELTNTHDRWSVTQQATSYVTSPAASSGVAATYRIG